MELGLAGKTVIITGGAANIGRGITFAFAKEGSNVVIADIDEEQAEKVINEAKGLGGKVVAIKTDITDYDSVEAMAKKTVEMFGSIDVLVNNVGWVADNFFMKKPREEWEKEIKINYLGMLNCTKVVLERMVERKSGRIVSVASDSARVGEPREPVYSGAKGAVVAFSKAVAREVGRHGIALNVVCPGATVPEEPGTAGKQSMWAGDITTAMIPPETKEKMLKAYPLGRLGRPEDTANAVVFLASDAASFITGQTLSVSGGYSMI